MNFIDAAVLALLALADIALLVRLRRARQRRLLNQRLMRSLKFAVDREVSAERFAPSVKAWSLRRAG